MYFVSKNSTNYRRINDRVHSSLNLAYSIWKLSLLNYDSEEKIVCVYSTSQNKQYCLPTHIREKEEKKEALVFFYLHIDRIYIFVFSSSLCVRREKEKKRRRKRKTGTQLVNRNRWKEKRTMESIESKARKSECELTPR